MTHMRMTTDSAAPWDAGTAAEHPHKHVRAERPHHHAAGSLPLGYIVLLSATAMVVVAAALLVALG
jgi:hypothetical protein